MTPAKLARSPISLAAMAALLLIPLRGLSGAGSTGTIIGINIATDASTMLLPTDVEGVVAAANWNNVVSPAGRSGSGRIPNLVDQRGELTGATFEFEAGFVNSNGNLNNGKMMNAWAGNRASDAPRDFSFSRLPASLTSPGYDVYVYFDSAASDRTPSFTVGGRTIHGAESRTGNFEGHFLEATGESTATATTGNHVVFRGLTAASFDLIADSDRGRGAVNGVQIVARDHAFAGDDRPNVVFLLADDFGWTDIASWGSDYYETPHLDRLGSMGMRFPRAYASPNCAPCRAALVSGQYAPRTGVYTVNSGNRGRAVHRRLDAAPNRTWLDLDRVTFVEWIRLAGYATCHVGKWHLGGPSGGGYPTAQGFEANFGGDHRGTPPPRNGSASYFADERGAFAVPHLPANGIGNQYVTRRLTTEAIDWMERNKHRPFFLYFSHFSVHTPKQARQADVRHFDGKPKGRHHRDQTYAGMVKALDDSVGLVVEYLERTDTTRGEPAPRKLIDNTIVIFYSDNGGVGGYADAGVPGGLEITRQTPLKSGKGSLYEGGIRVPLMVRWDGHVPAGSSHPQPVANVDWYPTLLEIAGVDPPPGHILDGESLLPLFTDPGARLRRESIFWHFPGYLQASSAQGTWRTTPVSVIAKGDWKLHYYYETESFELYNLAADIGESRNVATTRPDLLRELGSELRGWLVSTAAPLPRDKTTGREVALPRVAAAHFIRGDCDSDLKVNISDAIFQLQFLFTGGAPPACLEACETNGDARGDISDAIFLLQVLFLDGSRLPAPPYPDCGADPVARSSLGCESSPCP